MYELSNTNTRTFRLIYIVFLGVRIISSILPGYIHPDEFFQSGQEIFFGCFHFNDSSSLYESSQIPWEFQSQNAIRSIVPPMFMTLFPLKMYSFSCNICYSLCSGLRFIIPKWKEYFQENQCNLYNGYQIFIIPRLFIALCSIIAIDFPLWYLLYIKYMHQYQNEDTKTLKGSDPFITYQFRPIQSLLEIIQTTNNSQTFPPPIELLIYASSWPVLLFSNRTFTNTLETFALTLLLAIIQKDIVLCKESHSISVYLLVGMLCSIGLFIRFTFVFFAFPVIIFFLYKKSNDLKTNTTERKIWSSKRLYSLLYSLIWMGISFISISFIFIYVDTAFYFPNPSETETKFWKQITITPINAFLYNSKTNNLSLHGLHPRITHILVNMPMLYGPITIFFYLSYKSYFRSLQKDRLYTFIILFGLIMLSLAPHQEPRFLLPLSIPLMILHARDIIPSHIFGKQILYIWIAFNFIFYIFFGTLHQSGVIPSLLYPKEKPQAILYFHTYMPPTFLSRTKHHFTYKRLQHPNTCPSSPIIDLKGSNLSDLQQQLERYLSCDQNMNPTKYVQLITPMTLIRKDPNQEEDCSFLGTQYSCQRKKVFSWHVSTEDLPKWNGKWRDFLSDFKLVSMDVFCSNRLECDAM